MTIEAFATAPSAETFRDVVESTQRRRLVRVGPWVSYVVIVLAIGLWQIAASAGWIDQRLFSSPERVARAGWAVYQEGKLLNDLRSTFASLLLSMVLAIAVGELFGLLMGRVRRARYMFEWFLVVFNSMPRLVFVPVLILAFGIGMKSKTAAGFISAVIPIALFVAAGVRQVPPILVQVADSLAIPRWRTWKKVIVPASLPHLAGGTRIGFSRALISVVVTELLNPVEGLGRLIALGRRSTDPSRLIFAALLIGVVGMACVQLTAAVERRLAK